ncbi:transferase [Phascolomyces articulosus]|uniref:Transferase n=1 Tax=Phascolomyces articulosus TaxID=60185 RepID=A0AAD5JXX4_9FUNG|nr:transferase [Phascolomyces articulosus]
MVFFLQQFSCGTIVVASSLHHIAADLRGFLDFLELWAQLSRGEPIDFTKIPNDWSRTPYQYFERLDREPTAPPPFTVLPTPATGPYAYLTAPSEVTRWKFSKDTMKRLKAELSPSGNGEWISSGDALASIIAGAVTRARDQGNVERLEGRSTLESQTERIAMAADGRERAPRGNMTDGHYFGNFNNLWSVDASRADLLSATPEAASRIALAIRKELNIQLSSEGVSNRIAFFENPKIAKPPGRIVWSADVILTNWCRNDLEGTEFDMGWGKPFKATSGAGTVFPPGYSLMTQDGESGDITVLLTVDNPGAAALKSDPLLVKYAELL